MSVLLLLIPAALLLGLTGLAAFMWSVKSGQYDDLDGAAARILIDDEDAPTPEQDQTSDQIRPADGDPAGDHKRDALHQA